MVRLYKEIFGRGPTKARTEFSDSGDILICTLENSLTKAGQRMMKIGEKTSPPRSSTWSRARRSTPEASSRR